MSPSKIQNGDISPLEKTPLNVSRETKNRLEIFLNLVFQWQGKINLTGANTPQEFFHDHILDAVGAETVATKNTTCIDVGSGVGVPGLIWALLRPDTHFSLVESLQKRAAFLCRAIAKLEIKNVEVIAKPFETLRSNEIKITGDRTPQIVSRGTKSPPKLWPLILKSPIPFSEWLVFSSERTHEEFEALAKASPTASPMKVSRLPYLRPDQTRGLLTRIVCQ